MHPIRTRLTTRIASLTTTLLLAASTANAMQTTPPAKPISPERLAQLAEMRRQIADLGNLAEARGEGAGGETREAQIKLQIEMHRQPESEDTNEVVPLDANALVIASAGDPLGRSGISNLVASLNTALQTRNSAVTVGFDEMLGTVSLQGPRWQVEEAKGLASDLNAALARRIKEIRAAQLEQRSEDRRADDREDQERRRAAQEALRAKTVTISWNGGKLGDLIAAVQKQVPCNVVLGDPSVGEVPIPPLSVQLVSPEVFFQMLVGLQRQPDSEIAVFVVTPASIDPTATTPRKDDGSMSAITITRGAQRVEPIRRVVLNLQQREASELVDAIGFAMDAAGFTDKVKIRLHAPTNLLFMQGPEDAVRLAQDVIEATKAK